MEKKRVFYNVFVPKSHFFNFRLDFYLTFKGFLQSFVSFSDFFLTKIRNIYKMLLMRVRNLDKTALTEIYITI